ncbi:MAG: hypothetical protein KAF27_08830 [Porphyrobacter sp.]|nr:hypothetical protein [Porphyrobacter sp.]
MSLPPLLVQSAGSLAAILALAALARWLKLGGHPGLSDEAMLRRAAEEIVDGFEVADFSLAADRTAALVRDPEGRIMLIRLHGSRHVGRIISPLASARAHGNILEVDCREPRFGVTRLELEDAEAWAAAINAVGRGRDA